MLPLFADLGRLAYAIPLLVGVSLVYAATRHEKISTILRHALSFGSWTVVFMIVVAAVLEGLAFFQ